MFAYKTGVVKTLTCSGSMSGSMAPTQGVMSGDYDLDYLGTTGVLEFGINFAGVTVSGTMTAVAGLVVANPNNWTIQTTAQSSGNSTSSGPTTAPFPDPDGSFSMSIDVEEWVSITPDNLVIDSANGVIIPTQTATRVYYLATKPGGTISASCTFAGVGATYSETITESGEAYPELAVTVTASMPPQPGPPAGPQPGSGAVSFNLNWATSPVVSCAPLSASESSADASSSASINATSCSVSASCTSSQYYYKVGTVEWVNDISSWADASANADMWPAKSFSLTGEIFALDKPFSGPVDVQVSMYAGDPSPTFTASPSFTTGYSQQQYSPSCSAIAGTTNTVGPTSGGGTSTTTGGTDYTVDIVNQFQPVTAATTTEWCMSNNEFATLVLIEGEYPVNEFIYNNALRLHGYTLNAMSLALASPFNVTGASLRGWSGAWASGSNVAAGLQTTASINWSSTNSTLISNIQAALNALSLIGAGNVVVVAGSLSAGNGTLTITFQGTLASTNINGLAIGNSTNGTVTASQTTAGTIFANSVWTLTLAGISSGSFTITVGSSTITKTFQPLTQTSGSIAYSATSATLIANIQTALNSMSNIGVGNCVVSVGTLSGGNGTVLLTFGGVLSATPISQFGVGYSGGGSLIPSFAVPGGPSVNAVCSLDFGALSGSDVFSLTIGVGPAFFNMSGFRYLRFSNCLTTAAVAQTRMLTIAGKTWAVVFPAGTPGAVTIDLCDPTTGGAAFDLTDSILAPGDPNPTLSPAGGGTDGPLWGCTYVTSFSLGTFGSGSIESFSSVDLVLENETTAQFMTTWEPRFDNIPAYGPAWSNGSDTTFIPGNNRSAILITDGRQSMEWDGQSVIQVIGGESGVTTYDVNVYTIEYAVDRINAGYVLYGASVGYGDDPYSDYWTTSVGWVATKLAPAADGTTNLANGYLNDQLPVSWAYGDGVYYVPNGLGGGTWTTGIGVTPGIIPIQMLCSSIDFYPSCGDVFGFGGSGASPNVVYLVASKVYRAQTWGIAINSTTNQPASGTSAALFPTAGELQPISTVVGMATSEQYQGVYRTSGTALCGIDVLTDSSGEGGSTIYFTGYSQGTVEARYGFGPLQEAVQDFNAQKLSRVAFKVPPGPPPAGPGCPPCGKGF